jgi:hypothetical protein
MLVESRLMPYSDTSGLALDVSTPHSSTSQRYDQYQAPAASVIQVMIENLTGTPGEMKGKRFTDSSRGFSGRTPRTASGTLSALVHGVPYLETSRSKIQAATPTEFTGDKPTSIPLLSGVTLNFSRPPKDKSACLVRIGLFREQSVRQHLPTADRSTTRPHRNLTPVIINAGGKVLASTTALRTCSSTSRAFST